MTGLHLAFTTRAAADYACRVWHYSGGLPAGRLVVVGAWEDGRFIGTVVFSRGAASNIGRPFGLRQDQLCELTRLALGPHRTPTSRILTVAVRLLHRQSPGLQVIVSFADPGHGHTGRGVYAASGWLYLGETQRERLVTLHGRTLHARTVSSRYGTRGLDWLRQHVDPEATHVLEVPKHRYVRPLTAAMRRILAERAQPYPSRGRMADSGRPVPTGRGGANPTRPLHPQGAHG